MVAAMADVTAYGSAIRTPVQSRELALHALAERQYGRVATRQLLEMGFSRSGIRRWVAARRLIPVHPGVYAVGHAVPTAEAKWMAGVLAAGPGARLSHRCGAAAWEVRRTSSGLVEVTVASRSRRRLRGVRVHQTRGFHPEDVTELQGIPVTSLARTLLPARHADRVAHVAGGLVAGLEVLKSPGRFLAVVAWSLVLWLVNAASFAVCFRAFGLPLPAEGAFLLQGIIGFGVALPSSPGFIGVFEAATRGTLAIYGIDATRAVSYAVAYHVGTFFPITLLGLYSLSRMRLHLTELRAAAPVDD